MTGQGWGDAAVVWSAGAAMTAPFLAMYVRDRVFGQPTRRLTLEDISYEIPVIPPSLRPVDHVTCQNDDCDMVICFDGPTCADAESDTSCSHYRMLCHQHRTDCVDCRLDARASIGGGW